MRDQTAYLSYTQWIEFKERLLRPPLLPPALAFAAGIWLGSVFEINFTLIWSATFLSCAGILASLRRSSAIFWMVLAFFLAGILRINTVQSFPQHHVKFLEDGKGSLQGRVASYPETVVKGKKRMTRFLIKAESWRANRTTYFTEGDVQVFIFYASENIRYGERLRLRGTLAAPKRATNPEEFNYAAYLEKQGIHKVFQAFGRQSVRFLKDGGRLSWREQIEGLRFLIRQRIVELFPNPQSEVIQALWLGFRRNIPDEITNVFIRTGTIHLLSISGLHVTLVGGFFYLLFRTCGAARKLNALISIAVIIFYSLIAGGLPPVLRATCMGIFILGSILFEQDSEGWNILVVAFFLLILWNPGSIFLLSFQLSFLSMAVLILFSKYDDNTTRQGVRKFFEMAWRDKIYTWCSQTVRTSCLIVVVLLPVFASYFHLSSLLGIVANAIAIPASLWVMILSLTAFAVSFMVWPAATWLASLATQLFSVLFLILFQLSRIPFLNWHLASPTAAAVFLYYGMLGVCYWHPYLKRFRRILIAGFVFLFLSAFSFLAPQGVTFFDAGHSDAALLHLSGRRHLLITASRSLSESRLNWVVEPSLLSTGTRHLFVLFDDARNNLKRKPMTSLARNFDLIDFDGKLFPEATLFRLKNGKLAACWVKSNEKQILILFQANDYLIDRLSLEGIQDINALYLANPGKGDKLIRFLSASKAKHIIFNDRKLPPGFLNRLRGIGHSKIHFLSDGGAVSL